MRPRHFLDDVFHDRYVPRQLHYSSPSHSRLSPTGALNKLPIALSGLIFFDAPVTLASVSAIFVGFVSGIVYAVAKIWQTKGKSPGLPIAAPLTSASSQSVRDGLKP